MTWCHMSRCFSGSIRINIVKNITLKLSQAQKEHSLWKDYFPERCWILSSIGAIEFREFIKYLGEIERTCVCVCLLRQIILWYLIILLLRLLWKSSFYLFSDIPHSVLWRNWLHILANTLWPLSFKKRSGVEIFTICFSFSDSKYYGYLECISFIHATSIRLPSACSMLHTQQSLFISENC